MAQKISPKGKELIQRWGLITQSADIKCFKFQFFQSFILIFFILFMDTFSSVRLDDPIQSVSSYLVGESDSLIDSHDFNYLTQIFEVYLYQGPSWKLISEKTTKSKNPKNILNNGIRRVARTLSDLYIQMNGSKRRLITKQLILSMLEIINRTQQHIQSNKLTLNTDSKLFKFKETIVKLALWENALTYEQKLDLIKMLKQINIRLRSLGVFKVKHRKNWKMSDKALRLIASFDRIVVQQNTKLAGQQLQYVSNSIADEISPSSIISLDWHFIGHGNFATDQKILQELVEIDWLQKSRTQFFYQ